MKAKFINEYVVLPPKSKEDIIRDLSTLSKDELEEQLLKASINGYKNKIELLIDSGVDVNIQDNNGRTPLMWASWNGHLDVVNLLLINGADINIIDNSDRNALIYAKWNFHADIVELLKKNVAKESLEEAVGGAGFAVYGGGFGGRGFGNPSVPVGGRNFGRGFGFGSSQNLSGGPNLMYTYSVKPLNQYLQQSATTQDDEQYIHVGCKVKGVILNTEKEIEGQISFIEKDEDGNIKWYEILDEKGIKQKVDPTSTYLIKTDELIDPNKTDIVSNESLIFKPKYDEDIISNMKNFSKTELQYKFIESSKNGYYNIVEKLLNEFNININTKDKWGRSSLIWAVLNNHLNIVKLLLKNRANINQTGENLYTPLMYASYKGYNEMVEFLLKNGANINLKSNDGKTASSIADNNDILKLLNQYKDKITNESFYPSINEYVVLQPKSKEDIIKNLSILSKNELNNQLILTSSNGYKMAVELIIDAGADINARDDINYTPLIRASADGHTRIVEILLKNGADVNAKTNDGQTSLMKASRFGYNGIIKLLLKNGATVNDKNKKGYTALMLALENDHLYAAELLKEYGAKENIDEDIYPSLK